MAFVSRARSVHSSTTGPLQDGIESTRFGITATLQMVHLVIQLVLLEKLPQENDATL